MKTAKKTEEVKKSQDGLRITWKEVYRKQKSLLIAMIVLAAASLLLLILSLTVLRPHNNVVIVGYGDVYGEIAGISGGYRRSSWMMMLAFPILALIYGLLHNILVLRVYRKYGRDTALMLAVMSIILVAATVLVLFRLVGEW